MTKRKERTLKELYDITVKILEPEITPVLKGSCRIQGPMDETDHDSPANTGSFQVEKRFDRHSLSRKVHRRAESGTCNVCAAPCSSCMHFNRAVALMGSKTDEFSDETFRGKAASRCSFNDADVLSPFKSRACDDQQRTVSETSNLLSVSSSHDSLSENAESKVTDRTFDRLDASENVEIFPKMSSGETTAEEQLLSKPRCIFGHRTLTNQYEERKGLECDGDNVSCVSGANDANICDHNCDVDTENVPYNSASYSDLLPEGFENAVHVQNASGCLADIDCQVEESRNNSRKPSTCTKESIQKNSSATEVFSHKSEPSGIPSSIDVNPDTSLLMVRSPYSRSRSGKLLFCNVDAKVLDKNSYYHPQEEPSECSTENVESLLAKVATSDSVGDQKSAIYNCDIHPKLENNKATLLKSTSSGTSMKIYPCLEGETNMDSGDPPAEAMKYSKQSEQVEKPSLSCEVPDVQEPPLKSQPVDENDGSDIVEDDVKVCDICGDAGREDLLAICSRCSDGAEHTYCMQLMLDKIPEGDWLCEECKLKEETEKEMQDKFETVVVTSKDSSLNEKCPNSGSTDTFNSKLFVKLDSKDSNVEGIKTNKVSSSPHILAKRHADNLEVASAAKRQILESKTGSPKASSTSKGTIISRDYSLKNLEKGKVSPAHKVPYFGGHSANNTPTPKVPSFGGHSANKTLETAPSPTTSGHNSSRILPRLQTPKGTLLKSNSFSTWNSKPKMKVVEDDVSQKIKMGRETAISDTKKEGLVRMIGKSMSFKTAKSGCSNASESKVKMLSSTFSRSEGLKGLKEAKERNSIEKKSLFKSDRPLVSSPMAGAGVSTPKSDHKITSRGETMSSLSSATNYHDLKAVQPDGKLSSSSKQTRHLANKGLEIPIDLAGSVEVKKHSSYLFNAVGTPSSNGKGSSSDEQKTNQVSPKDELTSSSSWTADKLCRNPDANLQDVLPQSWESTNQDGKDTETSPFSSSRQNVSAASRSIRCHKCKEIGHAAQFCPIESPQVSVEAFIARNPREMMKKSSKLKAAIEAVMLKKPEIYKNKRFPDQFDELSMSSTELNCEVVSKDQLSSSSSCSKNIIPVKGTYELQDIFGSSTSDSCKSATANNVKLHAVHSTKTVFSPESGESDTAIPSNGKPSTRDSPRLASAIGVPFTIPEQDYIWQGGFEVQRSGRTEFCEGIQAHLSTYASPKVLEVVNKFPCKVLLEEVPRLSTWPKKFQDNCATEDNIALYFFAKDLDSYERNYRNLLENVIKNDLALRGNFDGIELLIFPSNQLPEKSRRWNMLFYLWGVFRGRRLNCSEHMSGSQRKLSASSLNMAPLDQDLPVPVMSVSRDISTPGNMDKDLSECNISCNALQASKSTASVELPFLSYSGRMDGDLDIKVSSIDQKCSGLRTNFDQQAGGLDSHSLSGTPMSDTQLGRGMKPVLTSLKENRDPESRQKVELQPCVQEIRQNSSSTNCKTVPVHLGSELDKQDTFSCSFKMLPVGTSLSQGVDEDKIQERMDSIRDQMKIQRKLKEEEGVTDTETAPEREMLMRDSRRDQMKIQRKLKEEVGLRDTETASERETLRRDAMEKEQRIWEINSRKHPHSGYPEPVFDGESECKKMKTIFSGMHGCNSSRERNSLSIGVPSRTHDRCPSFPTEAQRHDGAYDEMAIPGNFRTTERYFFPLDSGPMKECRSGGNSTPSQVHTSDEEDRLEFPNLELALGAKSNPMEQGILPLFVEIVDKKKNQDKPPDPVTNRKDDDALTLSLALPFSNKERTMKPVSKTEQLFPETCHVNTSLFLFSGLTDK